MIDAGYFAKRVVVRPEWLPASGVREVCSVSNCVSKPPEDWIGHWLHNELGWFDRIADARAVVPAGQTAAHRLFAYRIHPEFFRKGTPQPLVLSDGVHPDPIPATFRALGFDCVSKSIESSLGFDCSPLSCNSMAVEIPANEYCLFDSLDGAVDGARRFSIEQPEPGDYYVVQVLEGPWEQAAERPAC